MKNNTIIFGAGVFLLCLLLSGCTDTTNENADTTDNNDDYDVFVGSWRGDGIKYMEFTSDGTCVFTGITYTWSIGNNQLTLQSTNGVNVEYDYSFSDNDNTLTLTDTTSQDITIYARE